jgi:hypothetical protein
MRPCPLAKRNHGLRGAATKVTIIEISIIPWKFWINVYIACSSHSTFFVFCVRLHYASVLLRAKKRNISSVYTNIQPSTTQKDLQLQPLQQCATSSSPFWPRPPRPLPGMITPAWSPRHKRPMLHSFFPPPLQPPQLRREAQPPARTVSSPGSPERPPWNPPLWLLLRVPTRRNATIHASTTTDGERGYQSTMAA